LWFVPGNTMKSPSLAMSLDFLVALLAIEPVYLAALAF
jgi:hypothetical protein